MNEAFLAISNWEVDPRDEDMKRLFFQKRGVEGVLSGSQNVIIGRKGSGKTSIAEYIFQISRSHTRIFNLSDINFFEINEFLEDSGSSSGHNLFWRYMIYYLILEVMIRSNLLDYKAVKAIKSVISVGSDTDFMRRVSYLKKLDFKLSAFGIEASVNADRNFAQLSLSEKCALFEDVIRAYKGSRTVNLIFDELDSQFNVYDKESFSGYETAVKSLIVTSLDVKRRLPKLNPIVLIRDDIFDLITRNFSESNKLIDRTFELRWSQDELVEMCEHRLVSETAAVNVRFEQMFPDYPVVSKIMRQHKNRVSMPDYFFEHTMLRPRDVILFLREIARACLQNKADLISSNMMRVALPRYSIRFKQELVDEIHSSLREISDVFDTLTEMKFTKHKSDDLMSSLIENLNITVGHARKIMGILFYFSVIGLAEGSVMRFRYLDERARYVPSVNVELHPGIRNAISFFSH
jgi:hypothetical protein